MKDEEFAKKYKNENPNLKLISSLKADHGIEEKLVNPDIQVALAAQTALVIYQLEGYALITE